MNRTLLTYQQANMLEDAITLAVDAHMNQRRKLSNLPYIVHPLRVMAALQDQSYEVQVAAALHDTVEDTWVGLDYIRTVWGNSVSTLVDSLTRREGETYSDFTDRIIEAGPDAIRIKLADIEDNMNDGMPARPQQERYMRAFKRLTRALNG